LTPIRPELVTRMHHAATVMDACGDATLTCGRRHRHNAAGGAIHHGQAGGQGLDPADLDAAFSIYGRDEVMRWLGSRPRRPVDPDNVRSLAVCRRLGMTHRGQTTAYYGETLELFELSRAAVR
jgi:hypothetical protein